MPDALLALGVVAVLVAVVVRLYAAVLRHGSDVRPVRAVPRHPPRRGLHERGASVVDALGDPPDRGHASAHHASVAFAMNGCPPPAQRAEACSERVHAVDTGGHADSGDSGGGWSFDFDVDFDGD